MKIRKRKGFASVEDTLAEFARESTVGCGESRGITPADVARAGKELGRELSPQEVQHLRRAWASALADMEQP